MLLRWVWGSGFGCSRWQKAEILVKGSAKAALGWGEGRAWELCGWRQREALTSLGLESLGHSSPLLRLHGWNRGWHCEGLQPSHPHPPAPSWLLREQGQEHSQWGRSRSGT